MTNYNDLSEINPKIRYLNAKPGEIFIMNPTLYHCTDILKKNRKAISIRFIYNKGSNKIKLCNENCFNSILKINNKVDLIEKNDYIEVKNKSNLL